MKLHEVTANQAVVLTRVGEPLWLLIAADTPLGRRVCFLLDREWHSTPMYVYRLPPTPTPTDLPDIQQLGITQLPELRCYHANQAVDRIVGVQAIMAHIITAAPHR